MKGLTTFPIPGDERGRPISDRRNSAGVHAVGAGGDQTATAWTSGRDEAGTCLFIGHALTTL